MTLNGRFNCLQKIAEIYLRKSFKLFTNDIQISENKAKREWEFNFPVEDRGEREWTKYRRESQS